MTWICIYDEDKDDVAASVRQLRFHGIAEVLRHVNRIDLFEEIAEREDPLIALIDLQADDKLDNNFSGHRVIETIRRNPRLAARCQPVAYTVHARPDVVDLARRHGAVALISKHDLDVPREQVDLPGFLERLRAQPLAGFGEGHENGFEIFPGTERAKLRTEAQETQLDLALDEVLISSDARIVREPYFWQFVRYLADGLDVTSVVHWIAVDFGLTDKAVKKAIEDLRGYLEPQYTVHGVQWNEFARDLLKAAPARRVAPLDEQMLRVLHRISELEAVLRDPAIRRDSHLDADALAAVDLVLDPYKGMRLPGNPGHWQHTDALKARMEDVEPDAVARIRLQANFVRAVNNIYDTYIAARKRA
jgi:CheY-like chemotaxis protein